MQFLDRADQSSQELGKGIEETATSSSSSSRGGDNVSPLVSPSRAKGTSSVPKYVWDEWQHTSEETGGGAGSSVYDDSIEATYFSVHGAHLDVDGTLSSIEPSIQQLAHGGSLEGDSYSTVHFPGDVSSVSLQDAVGEVKRKMGGMKQELRAKTKQIEALRTELNRWQAIKARREEKFCSVWSGKRRDMQEEHDAQAGKHAVFTSKLEKDIKDLRDKLVELKGKLVQVSAQQESALNATDLENKRDVARARGQWDLEEKTYTAKIIANKADAMKKAAADSFAPQLEKLVADGKAAARRIEEENGKMLGAMRSKLQSTFQESLNAALSSTREQLRAETEATLHSAERRQAEALERHAEEVVATKEKHVREKDNLEETAERARQIEAESALQNLKTIRKIEAAQCQELVSNNQRELAVLITGFSSEREQYRQRLEEEIEEWQKRLTEGLIAEQERKVSKLRITAESKAAAEAEAVLRRLSEEHEQERTRLQDRLRKELDVVRAEMQQQVDANRALLSDATARRDVRQSKNEALEGQVAAVRADSAQTELQVQQAQARASELRTNFQTLQDELERSDAGLEKRAGERKLDEDSQTAEWQSSALSAEAAAEAGRAKYEQEKADLEHKLRVNLDRILEKVSQVRKTKDHTVKELRRKLSEFNGKNKELQEILEYKRTNEIEK
jgi:hypothetical protein